MKISYINIFLFISILSFRTKSLAQNKLIDSLENELKIHKEIDTLRVKLLNTLAFKYYNKHDLQKATKSATEANRLSVQIDFIKGEAKSAYLFCKIHMKKSENNEATEDCLHALKLYKEVGNDYAVATTYNILGNVSVYQNNPDKALEYYTKAFAVAKEMGHLERQSEILINIGNISYQKGDLDIAIDYYKKSMTINEKIGNKNAIGAITNNIATIYVKQGRSTEALEYLNKNLLISKEENNKEKIASATLNIGTLYFELEQYEKGIDYMKDALLINKELDNKRKIAHCLAGIGAAYAGLNEHQKALPFFTEGITINKAIDNKHGLFTCLHQLGGLNMRMNEPNKAVINLKKCLEISQSLGYKVNICNSRISLSEAYLMLKNYPKALDHALKGKKTANALKLIQEKKIVNHLLSQIHEANRNYKESLNNYKEFKTLNDSLFDKEKIENIAQIESKYKYKKALDSASIRELKLTKTVMTTSKDLEKSQRNLLLGIIAFLTVALLMGAIIFFLKLRHEKSKTQNVVIEQKLLRSQMTPHFIFNSLSVLQGMILNKEEENAVSYLSKFSKLLRTVLENSRHKTVTLSEELSAIDDYMALQNLDVNPPFKYELIVASDIDQFGLKIPPMLIQPFIENAIEHAFPNKKENKVINLTLTFNNNKLLCTIKDNGIGVNLNNKSSQKNKNSLATKITSERLKTLSKDFNAPGSVSIKNRLTFGEQGTLVNLVIPYKID